MSYQAQEWTTNALSVELKIDRRTVAKRLEKVRPCRVEGIAKYYLMVDAAPALLMPRDNVVTESGEVIDFNAQRARLTKEQADKLERERREDERELVRRGPIEAALAAQDQALKDRLLMVPVSGAAEALAAGGRAGAPGIADVYERHINRALADLASAELVPAAAS